jgi:hypothetical protein
MMIEANHDPGKIKPGMSGQRQYSGQDGAIASSRHRSCDQRMTDAIECSDIGNYPDINMANLRFAHHLPKGGMEPVSECGVMAHVSSRLQTCNDRVATDRTVVNWKAALIERWTASDALFRATSR